MDAVFSAKLSKRTVSFALKKGKKKKERLFFIRGFRPPDGWQGYRR